MHDSTVHFLVNYGPGIVIATAALALGLMVVAGVAFFISNVCTGCAKQEHVSHGKAHH